MKKKISVIGIIVIGGALLLGGCSKSDTTSKKEFTTTEAISAESTTSTESKKEQVTDEATSNDITSFNSSSSEDTSANTVQSTEANESESANNETVTSSTAANDFKTAAKNECLAVLNDINTNTLINDDSNFSAIKCASHMMNWAVGTTMTPDEIKDAVTEWYTSHKENENILDKFNSVYTAYKDLLKDGQEDLLASAGCEDAAYPWSNEPLEPVEIIFSTIKNS